VADEEAGVQNDRPLHGLHAGWCRKQCFRSGKKID
jgi:hypothetical protein